MAVLQQNDPQDLLAVQVTQHLANKLHQLIKVNDDEFIGHLEVHRASVRYRNIGYGNNTDKPVKDSSAS
ncbi:hypothetical protein O9993_22075 [Vibrio lentus]|nr:hypothetical protein [Vibrio lentus]